MDVGPNSRRMGHRAELFRYPGPAAGGGRRNAAPDRRGAVGVRAIRRPRAAQRAQPADRPTRATAQRAGCWRSSFTACGRGATGATAISPISPSLLEIVADLGGAGDRAQSAARAVLRPAGARAVRIRRTAGCFSIRSTSTSRRSRNSTAPIARQARARDRAAARRRAGRLCRGRDAEARGAARGLSEFCVERQRGAPCRLRSLSARSAAGRWNASRRSRRLRGRFPGPWWEWPAPWRKPTDEALRRLRESHPDEIGFHEFLQWNAERQLEACRDIARRRGLSDRPLSRHRGRRRSRRRRRLDGAGRRCCAGCRSARRPTSSIPPARIGG